MVGWLFTVGFTTPQTDEIDTKLLVSSFIEWPIVLGQLAALKGDDDAR